VFKECRAKYKYQNIERLRTIDSKVDALYLGTGGHAALQAHYLSLKMKEAPLDLTDEFEKWVAERQEKTGQMDRPDGDTTHMIHNILHRYQNHYEDMDNQWEIIDVELMLRAKIPGTSVWLGGQMDLLVKWRGSLWVVDHKFLRAINPMITQQLELDDQMTGYIWLLRQNGIRVRGAIYNVIRKKLPTVPELLKNGSLTSRKDIDTDYDTYMQAIVDNDLVPEDYEEILSTLRDKPSTFFHREVVTRNDHELAMFGKDLVYEARDMTSKSTYHYITPGQHCGWCQFRILCKSDREGGDTEFTKQHLYRVREADER
jgi:hypothetical protein